MRPKVLNAIETMSVPIVEPPLFSIKLRFPTVIQNIIF